MNKTELENMMFAVMAGIPKKLAEDFAQDAKIGWSLMDDWTQDMLTISIRQRIFGKQVLHDVISYPANWKEAFKERWYPAWAKDKWPVRYATKTFDVRELVPSLSRPGFKSLINVDVT